MARLATSHAGTGAERAIPSNWTRQSMKVGPSGFEPPRSRRWRALRAEGFYGGREGVTPEASRHLPSPMHRSQGGQFSDGLPEGQGHDRDTSGRGFFAAAFSNTATIARGRDPPRERSETICSPAILVAKWRPRPPLRSWTPAPAPRKGACTSVSTLWESACPTENPEAGLS